MTNDASWRAAALAAGAVEHGPLEALELRGAPVARALCEGLVPRVETLIGRGDTPCLAVVRVGEQPGDLAYERGARSRMAKVGINFEERALPDDVTQGELETCLRELDASGRVSGILLLRPLPRHLDAEAAAACVSAAKDVDGMTAASLAATFAGRGEGFAPCTAEAVVRLLEHYQVPLSGARVVVLGRSLVVGRPVAQLLLARDATVMLCHSRTRDLSEECRRADVVVSCMGRAGSVRSGMLAPGSFVADVGTSDDGNGGITGDVRFSEALGVAAGVTPVPRGVGSVTTSVLAEHVVRAAELAAGVR